MLAMASEALAFVLKHWKIVAPCILLIVVGAWGAAQERGKQKAKRSVAELRLELQMVIVDHKVELASRDDVIKALRSALSDWEAQATAGAARAEEAERQAQAIRDAHSRDRGRLEEEIRSLTAHLESLPEAERYEETRRWAIETYQRLVSR